MPKRSIFCAFLSRVRPKDTDWRIITMRIEGSGLREVRLILDPEITGPAPRPLCEWVESELGTARYIAGDRHYRAQRLQGRYGLFTTCPADVARIAPEIVATVHRGRVLRECCLELDEWIVEYRAISRDRSELIGPSRQAIVSATAPSAEEAESILRNVLPEAGFSDTVEVRSV